MSRNLRVGLSAVFSFEMLFVLFMYAGRFKADPRFAWVPIDLTLLFFALSVVVGILILAFSMKLQIIRQQKVLLFLILAFIGYALFSLYWSPGHSYAQEKVLQMATLMLWSFIATCLIIAPNRTRVVRFLLLLALFSAWIVVESALAALNLNRLWTVNTLGTNYLGLGRVIGVGALVLLGYLIFYAPSNKAKWAIGIVIGAYLAVLLLLGGKAPLLATLAAAAVPALVGVRRLPGKGLKRGTYFLVIVIVIGILLYMFTNSPSTTITLSRMSRAFTDTPDFGRLDLWQSAIEFWAEAPITGHGVGAWPILYYAMDARSYPHNVILEILVEFGLLGLVLFASAVIYGILLLWNGGIARSPLRIIVLMLFVNTFGNALASGDIPENRMLFAMIGLMTLSLFEGVVLASTKQTKARQRYPLHVRRYPNLPVGKE